MAQSLGLSAIAKGLRVLLRGVVAIEASRSRSESVFVDLARMRVTRGQLHRQPFASPQNSALACHTVTPELNSRGAVVRARFSA